jgi:SPX domain protein involved in polyphosphate accumulation
MSSENRFECKYLVPRVTAESLRSVIGQYLTRDRYCKPDRDPPHYDVLSLYLDDPGLSLYRGTTEGLMNRYKLRLRSYEDRPEAPVFFEIKSRRDATVQKKRAAVRRNKWESIVGGLAPAPGDLVSPGRGDYESLVDFTTRMMGRAAGPVCFIRYRREAFSLGGDRTLRITLDWDLAAREASDGDFRFHGDDWRPVDPGNGFDNVILEIKFHDSFPGWVQEIIRSFDLKRISVPKYVRSVNSLQRNAAVAPRERSVYR